MGDEAAAASYTVRGDTAVEKPTTSSYTVWGDEAAAVPSVAPSSYTVWGDEGAASAAAVPNVTRDPGPVDTATSNTTHNDGHEVLRLRGGGEEEEEWGEWPDEDEEGEQAAAAAAAVPPEVEGKGGGESSSSEEEGESSEAEEGASSDEEDATDDIEVTETFDEVEFGDGDESHQIYSNMSGIVITWNTCAEDTFKVFREEICDMFGVQPNDFYLAYHSKVDQRRAQCQRDTAWRGGQHQLPRTRKWQEGAGASAWRKGRQ